MLWKSDGSFTYLEIVQETNPKQSHARTLSGTKAVTKKEGPKKIPGAPFLVSFSFTAGS